MTARGYIYIYVFKESGRHCRVMVSEAGGCDKWDNGEASIAFADDSWSTKEDEESTYTKVGSVKPAPVPGSCGRSPRNALGEPSIQT